MGGPILEMLSRFNSAVTAMESSFEFAQDRFSARLRLATSG